MTASSTAVSNSAASAPHEQSISPRRKLRADDLYFGAMVLLILGTVFLGFARTYYLAPIYHTHVRNLLIGVHGAVFSAWVVLLVVQTTLVARRNIALHRRLGIFGACLAVAMVGLGVAVATDSLSRGASPPRFPFGPVVFFSLPIFSIAEFAVLIFFALWLRSNGPAHKRLVLLATLALMGPAVSRWPFAFTNAHTVFIVEPDGVVSRCVRPVNDSTNSSRHTPGWTLLHRDRRSCSAYRKNGRMAYVRHLGFACLGSLLSTGLKTPPGRAANFPTHMQPDGIQHRRQGDPS